MELVCPAGNLPALKAAIDAGADAVYIGFQNDTNARHFAGLNFDASGMRQGIAYAHARGRHVYLALNTYPQPSGWPRWQAAVDAAAELGVDALIVADTGVLDYASTQWPELRLHLSVQGSATNSGALRFYYEQFNIQRAVVPRVLSLRQVAALIESSPVPIEVFGFGSRGPLLPVVLRNRRIAQYLRRLLARQRGRMARNGGGPRNPAQRHPHRPFRSRRARGLSNAVQGPLQGRGPHLLRHRGTDQPQYPHHPARARRSRCGGGENRRATAQSRLCRTGRDGVARGAGRLPAQSGRLQRPSGMAEGARQSVGRRADHARRPAPPVAMTVRDTQCPHPN